MAGVAFSGHCRARPTALELIEPADDGGEPPWTLQSLGYVGLRAKSLDDWESYGTRLLGMQRVDKTAATLALRMDDRKQRVIVHADGGEGIDFFGFEVADGAALNALAAKLESHGVGVARGTRALADERFVKDLIVFSDPIGNRIEVFHGAEVATDAFLPGRAISGFRTGPLGMGHVVLTAKRVDDVLPFYRDVLGFRLSDYFRAAGEDPFLPSQSAPPHARIPGVRQATACIT